jgi:hypothetical protein
MDEWKDRGRESGLKDEHGAFVSFMGALGRLFMHQDVYGTLDVVFEAMPKCMGPGGSCRVGWVWKRRRRRNS